MTRNWAGTMSSRSETSSPMQCRQPPQVQVRLSGSITSSTRGRCLGKRSTIGGTRFGGALGSPILGILFGMDRRHGRFQILQRQFELVRIALLRPPPERCLLEGRDQLFQPCDPLVLAPVARLRGDQHRLQCRNFLKQISGVRHGWLLPNHHKRCLKKAPNKSSCRRAEPVIPRLREPSPRWPEPAASRAPQTVPRTAHGLSASTRPSRRAR